MQFCAAPPTKVVDTLGAGDSFIAGYLAAMLAGGESLGCLEAGTKTAIAVLGQEGAWSNSVVEMRRHLPDDGLRV